MSPRVLAAWHGSIVVAVTFVMLAMPARPASAAEPVRIKVRSGVLVGTLDSGVESFKGVPYATPPVGALRWTLPRPAAAWAGERAADDFGPSCTQDELPRNVPPASRGAQLSEDCLTLNVWAPQTA